MSERSCLICGIAEAEVKAVRNRDGYTLGCGIESNTENGFDYEELSPRHRWAPWTLRQVTGMGIRAAAYGRYRFATVTNIQYAACDDTVRGHVWPSDVAVAEGWADAGRCWRCGAKREEVTA